MKNGSLRDVVQFIHHIAPPGRMDDAPDGQLLECFIDRGDETAFAALLRRHGPLVLAVCRRALPCVQDAEDAFQATFLVLVRNARSIAKRGSVASWLHGVAHRIARRARADIAKRRALEGRGRPAAAPDSLRDLVWRDLRSILDEEVSRLPEKYRAAFVLCCMEGKSNEEAARLLRCPRGTVSSRLVRARALLRERLTGRGLALSAALVTTTIARGTAASTVPGSLAGPTIRAALQVKAGRPADAGVASARVITLMEGGLKTMTKLKLAAVVLLPLALVAASTGARTLRRAPAGTPVVAQEPEKPAAKPNPRESADPPRPPAPVAVEPPGNPAEKYLGLGAKKLKGLDSFVAQVRRTVIDKTFQTSEVYDGMVKYLKPDMSVLEMHKKDKPQVMEKFLRAGPLLYFYYPEEKKIVVNEMAGVNALPPGFGGLLRQIFAVGSLPFSFVLEAEETKKHYDCTLLKMDGWYIYIEFTPRTPASKSQFQKARLVLNKKSYLPRELWLEQPNGNEIKWDIPKIEVNVPLPREAFTKPKVPEGWKLERVPQETGSLPTKEASPPSGPSGR